MTRELGKCPECGGRLMRCGPEDSGRMRRTCLRTCRQAPKDERILPIDRSPAHAKQLRRGWHDVRLGRAGLVGLDG